MFQPLFLFFFFFSLSFTLGEATASKLDMDGSVAPDAAFVNGREGLIFLLLTLDLLFATQVKTKGEALSLTRQNGQVRKMNLMESA